MAHAHDLRAEIEDMFNTDEDKDAYVHGIVRNWRETIQDPITYRLCEYAEKLSCSPQAISSEDIDSLRAVGLSDVAIHDATQVIAYFNYINRIADALGVEPEDFIREWGSE